MLIAELERGLLRGEDAAGSALVLQELRRSIRAETQPVPRIGDTARMFFAPLEPFLIDGRPDHKRLGRLARASLEPVWQWIGRDLMPAETKALTEDINRALLANDRVKAEHVVRALQGCAIQRIKAAIAAVDFDEKAKRKLGVQVGTPRALEDVTTLLHILEIRDAVAEWVRRLPSQIRAFEREQIDQAKALIDAVTAAKQSETGTARKSDIYLYGLVVVMSRLAAPWQLIRLATRAADSDVTARIAETPYAVAVTIVLSEVENTVSELRSELKAGRPVASMLKDIHDAARGLRTEMDLSFDSAWSRQLAAIRGDVSDLLKAEIETTPGRVRRLLRPRPDKEIAPGSVLDSVDVSEVEARVEFVGVCRNYAGELAASEVTLRTYSELQHYLETGTKVLLNSLRSARRFRPPLPAISGRCRDQLLSDRVWDRICRAPGESRRGRRAIRDRRTQACPRMSRKLCGATLVSRMRAHTSAFAAKSQCVIAAPEFPLRPHSCRDVTTGAMAVRLMPARW